jgi:O-antigen biosynthesis protein
VDELGLNEKAYASGMAAYDESGGSMTDFKKPRVSIWYYVVPQTGFRNDGAPLFMHYNFRKILNNEQPLLKNDVMGEDSGNVVHLQPNEPISQHGTFDLNVLVDHGEDVIGVPLDFVVPHPNAYWAFDTHIDEKGYKYRLERAKQFDNVFLCHKAQISDFIRDGINPYKIHYLPCAAEQDCYKPYPVMKKWDWCFIGHMNSEHRIDLLDRFIKEFGLGEDKGYLGYRMAQIRGHCVLDDAAKKFSMSHIVINDSIRKDLNMRTFEAMACKTVLLTEANEPLLELFKDGEHLVTYNTIDEAVELARGLLADPERRKVLAEAGYAEIISKHTYHHRALEILEKCIGYTPKGEHLVTAHL